MKTIKDILETIALVILICIAAIGAFVLFAGFYYWYLLIFESWLDNVCGPWIVEQIKVIFRHPENFCFALGMVVISAGSACMLYIAISEAWEKRKNEKRKAIKRIWSKIADICETVIVIILAILLLIMAFTQSEPVDVYNMPVEEQTKYEQMILGK